MELIEGFGADGSYLLFVSVRKVESAAGIRSRDLDTLVRALPVLLAIQQLSPKGLHPPWLEAVSVYGLALWTTALAPLSFAFVAVFPQFRSNRGSELGAYDDGC